MPDWTKWLARANDAIKAEERAVGAWGRIQRDAVSVVIVRGADDLVAQTVRIEQDTTPSMVSSDAGQSGTLRATLFGVRGHPDEAVSDTDVKAGDRFANDGRVYKVVRVLVLPGEVQAMCEST